MHSLDNRHKWALPYWARPGIVSFAKPATGGGGDDGLDDDEDDDEDDEDDEDEGKTDEELKAELKAVRKSLEKANGSSAKRRGQLRERERELTDLRAAAAKAPKVKKDDEDDKPDAEAIRAAALAEGKKAGDERVKFAEVKTALAAAGVTDKKTLARLARMVDLKDLDLDDDGEVDGLDEVIDELKADMPALFGGSRKRRSVAGEADRNGESGKSSKPKTATELQAAALRGKG